METAEPAVMFISYLNGSIRTPEGKLVAFYDPRTGQLDVDGHIESFTANSIQHAMDIVKDVWIG